MRGFSPSDAALEGFQVLRQHWRVVVGWAGFAFVAVIAMVVVTVIVAVPMQLLAGGPESNDAVTVASIIWPLGMIGVMALTVSALFRLMLRSEQPEFLYLRIGADELRILAVLLALGLCKVLILWAGAGLVAVAAKGGMAVTILIGVILILSFFALAARFGLAPVMTFADRRLRLAAAWRLGRGHTVQLAGMALLAFCLVAFMAGASWVGLFLLGGVLTGFQDLSLSGVASLEAHPGRVLFQVVTEMMLIPVFLVLLLAPWVAAYRALSADPA